MQEITKIDETKQDSCKYDLFCRNEGENEIQFSFMKITEFVCNKCLEQLKHKSVDLKFREIKPCGCELTKNAVLFQSRFCKKHFKEYEK